MQRWLKLYFPQINKFVIFWKTVAWARARNNKDFTYMQIPWLRKFSPGKLYMLSEHHAIVVVKLAHATCKPEHEISDRTFIHVTKSLPV